MLKGVPSIISPELLKILAEMGHGDEIVICDANCPAARLNKVALRCEVRNASELLDAILTIFPLDTYEKPVYMMEKVKGDEAVPTDNWDEYYEIVKNYTDVPPEHVERFAFYERAKGAYLIIATGEKAIYANILLKKGVVK